MSRRFSDTSLSKLSKNSELEAVAKKRAIELATLYDHTRPNGTSCFTLYPCSTRKQVARHSLNAIEETCIPAAPGNGLRDFLYPDEIE